MKTIMHSEFEGSMPGDNNDGHNRYFRERLEKGKSMPDDELIKKCDDWIHSLAKSGGKTWCLSIPVRFDVDPDMLFTELISRYQSLRSELQKQKELNAELLKYEVSPRVAGLIIQVRDAIATKDYDEAYHILYQIASPGFNKTDPWGELEFLIKKYNPT